MTSPKLHGTLSICPQGKANSLERFLIQAEHNKVASWKSTSVYLFSCTEGDSVLLNLGLFCYSWGWSPVNVSVLRVPFHSFPQS